jgi:hypothetical protein
MRCQERQDQAREEKPRGQQRRGPCEHVRRTTAGHEPARGADQASTLGFLQQNHADQGKDEHQVDGDNDTQHRLIRYWPRLGDIVPARVLPRYGISERSLHDPPWIFYGGIAPACDHAISRFAPDQGGERDICDNDLRIGGRNACRK